MSIFCFLCNEIGEWPNLVSEATQSTLSKVLNEDLNIGETFLCDNCNASIDDYVLYESKLEALSKRINSLYSVTSYVRQHSVALNSNTEELIIEEPKFDSALHDVIMVYENVVDGDLIEEEQSDGNVSEFIEEDPMESEIGHELLLTDQEPLMEQLEEAGSEQPYVVKGEFFTCKLCNPSEASNAVEYDLLSIESHLWNQHGVSVSISNIAEDDPTDTESLALENFDDNTTRTLKRSHVSNDSKNHSCNSCDKKFASAKLLEEHLNSHDGVRPFTCSKCSKDFSSKYTLAAHVKTHTERPRPYKCDLCPKAFLTSHNLDQHKKLHSNVKNHVCEVCQKGFATEHNLNVHKIVHEDFKPFICRWPDCGKSFARRNEIKDHERIHTGEKPFECEICGTKFSQRSNLLSHKKATHLNEKRFACEECDKAFKRRRLLDYHIKACHTGERPLKCETCGATFVYPEHFKKHRRNCCQVFKCVTCELIFHNARLLAVHQVAANHQKTSEKGTVSRGGVKQVGAVKTSRAVKNQNRHEFLDDDTYTIVNIVNDDYEDDEDVNV